MTRVWKGNMSSFTLEHYIQMHCQAFISMVQCADHIDFQIPNERTRVKHMIDNIQCTDPELLSLLALVKNDDNLMSDFEAASTMILPACPISRKAKQSGKSTTTATVSALDTVLKEGRGDTGVEFRWYGKSEYAKLSEEQKKELRDWKAKGGKVKNSKKEEKANSNGPKKKSQKAKFKAQISSLEKKFEEKIDELTKNLAARDSVKVGSVVAGSTEANDKSANVGSTQGHKVSLQSILKRNDVQVGAVVASNN